MRENQLVRFIVTGSVNTLFYYLLYAFFIFMSFPYQTAVLLATTIGAVFSYITFGKYVFSKKRDFWSFVRFGINYTLLYFLNISIIALLQRFALENLYASGLVATIVVAGVSFFTNKYFVYKDFE